MKLDKIFNNILWFLGAARVINNFPDAIVFVDKDGYITQLNRKAGELFIISDGINPVKLDEIIVDGMNTVEMSIKSRRPILAQADVGGHCFYVELTASKRRNGYCVSMRNKTQSTSDKNTEHKILKFNNEKNAMLIKLRDDINSPIESIKGFTKTLLDTNLDEKQAKYLNIIKHNSSNLETFITKLLDFTYAESLLYEPDYKKFDTVAEIKEIIKTFDKQIDFDYDSVENRLIHNDYKAFKQIVTNILETSNQMTESGNISVTLSPVNEETALGFGLEEGKNYIQITIRDTGVGIEPDEIKSLCDPYFHAGKKDFMRALRLGTASIMVKRSDGFIDIGSELMRGTIYNVVLPADKEKDE